MINTKTPVDYFLLLFWACCLALMFLSNAGDIALAKGLATHIAFHSGNLILMTQAVAIYHFSPEAAFNLFLLNTFCQGFLSLFFFRAFLKIITSRNSANPLPFVFNIIYWGVFILFEEYFMTYPLEHAGREIFALALLSLIIIQRSPL